MSIENKFYVDFETEDGGILATTVTIGSELVRDMGHKMNIALAAHPRYARLERYVLANPSGQQRQIQVGDVVQINPETGKQMFAGCFMIVTEVKSWGVQGAIACPQAGSPGQAFFRANYADIVLVGAAPFRFAEDFGDEPTA